MSLDCVMLLNLERREDRYWSAVGSLGVLGFYDDIIIRFLNHDGSAYKDTKSVQAAAVADGFDEFGGEWRANCRADAAWYWSYRCALRRIIEMNKTVLLLIDDFVPFHRWTYERFRALVSECLGDDHGFRIIQLMHTAGSIDTIDHTPHTSMLAKGLSGYVDYGVIINAEGAKLVLDTLKDHPYASPEHAYSIMTENQGGAPFFHGLWHTLDPILRGTYGFPSEWSVEGASYPEPWEVK